MAHCNFPIAILRQVRTNERGNIQRDSVDYALKAAVGFALYVAYQKEMPPDSTPDDYSPQAFVWATEVLDLEYLRHEPEIWISWSMSVFGKYKDHRVIVGCNSELLLGFIDNLDYKSDFEIIQLQAFLAIRSIIGVCSAKQIKWQYVLSRMAGYEKAVKSVEALPEYIARYSSRRMRDKLIRALCDRWHMMYYGKNLGKSSPPWFSFDPDIDLEAHARLIKQRRKRESGAAGPSSPESTQVEILSPCIFGNSTLW